MAIVLLTSSFLGGVPNDHWNLGPWRVLRGGESRLAACHHRLTTDPQEADWILFADPGPKPYFESIRSTALYRHFANKTFVICQDDYPLALLPGVYTCVERRWMDRSWIRSGCYVHDHDRFRFEHQPFPSDPVWLFSFVGSISNAAVRRRLMELRHPRGEVRDVSGQFVPAFSSGDEDQIRYLVKSYEDVVRNSRFVLCPRGVGCSSQRLFEVMRMGRAPVVISDDWVAPEGPEWRRFLVRIPETQLASVPQVLERLESQAHTMGAAAREAWEQWFSHDITLLRVIESIESIRHGWSEATPFRRRAAKRLQFFRPFHFRNRLRTWKRQAELRYRS